MRALRAPLSPHEENTLRRIAHGNSTPEHLPQRDVLHLRQLELVDLDGDGVCLTEMGAHRYLLLCAEAAQAAGKHVVPSSLRPPASPGIGARRRPTSTHNEVWGTRRGRGEAS